jgi:rSAM/selenodomain-associated transferase 1
MNQTASASTNAEPVPEATRVVVFAKAPLAGVAKTRLIPALGAQGAATLARRMLAFTLEKALLAHVGPVELCMSPHAGDPAWQGIDIPNTVQRSAQGPGDLGDRMARAVQRCTSAHRHGVILIGTDCPALTPAHVVQAARMLVQYDAVMLPATDGGYVLLGLKAPCPEIFTAMPWSTAQVAALTQQRLAQLGLRVWQGEALQDIDEPADLAHIQSHHLMVEMGCSPHQTCASSSQNNSKIGQPT